MAFTVRPFAACVAALAASRPDEKLEPQQPNHHDSAEAYAFESLAEWSDDPPITSLYRQKGPLGSSSKVLDDPGALVDYANFGNAVATWNANGEARWQRSAGEWILADVSLVQEQASDDDDDGSPGDHVDVIFALWKVEDGWAAGVWEPHRREELAAVMGLDAWPADGWAEAKVWYGE